MTPAFSALAAALLLAAPPPAPPPEPAPPLSRLEADALARAEARLPQRTRPVLSAPLVDAARALARAAAAGAPRPLSAHSLRAALGDAGVFDPAPAAVVLSAPPSSLADAVADAVGFRGATHLGIGVEERGGLAWAVLLATERRAELAPVPRQVAPGGTVRLRGRLVRLDAPRVHVTSPSGAVREVPVRRDGDGFAADVTLAEPGTHRIEVGGTGARGPTVAALLDVSAGDPSPEEDAADVPDPVDDAAAEAIVVAAVDALRVARGLAPLRREAALDAEARRHSAAMLAAGTVAHRVAGGGDVASRVSAAGVAYRTARENVARGDGAWDAHRAVTDSPAHRANLLAPDVSLLGLGIARGRLPGGQPVTYLTEILVAPRDTEPAGASAPAGDRDGAAPVR